MPKEIVVFKLIGTRPLLCRNPASMKSGSSGVGKKEIPTPEAEAKLDLYMGENGVFTFPTIAVRNAMISAAASSRLKDKSSKLTLSAILSASVFPQEEFVPIVDPKTGEPLKEYKIDMRRAIVNKQGIVRCRPRFDAWALRVSFEIETGMLSGINQYALQMLNLAGEIVGIGDYRVQKRGLFGQFKAEMEGK